MDSAKIRQKIAFGLKEYVSRNENLRELLEIIAYCKCESVFLGGIVRDAAYGRYDSRDVDICVKGDFERLALHFPYARRNRFGGLKIFSRGVTFDLWDINTTFSLRGKKNLQFENLLDIQVFSADSVFAKTSVVSSPYTHGSIRMGTSFEETIKTKTLFLNSSHSYDSTIDVVRGVHLINKFDLKCDSRVVDFLNKSNENCQEDQYKAIQEYRYNRVLYNIKEELRKINEHA